MTWQVSTATSRAPRAGTGRTAGRSASAARASATTCTGTASVPRVTGAAAASAFNQEKAQEGAFSVIVKSSIHDTITCETNNPCAGVFTASWSVGRGGTGWTAARSATAARSRARAATPSQGCASVDTAGGDTGEGDRGYDMIWDMVYVLGIYCI